MHHVHAKSTNKVEPSLRGFSLIFLPALPVIGHDKERELASRQ